MPHTSGLPDVTPESVRWPVPSCPPHVVPEQAVTLKRQRRHPLKPCSGSSVQGAGPQRRLATTPRHLPRLALAVQPRSTRTQVQPALPGSRAFQGLPLAPTTHPGKGVVPRTASVNSPLAPPLSRALRRCVVPGLESGSRAAAGLQATQKLRPSSSPRARGRRLPTVQGTLLTPLLDCGRARGACRQPYQLSKE